MFLSYSHADRALRNELLVHLVLLERLGIAHSWDDQSLTPGSTWEATVRERLEAAKVILILLTPDFLASDYCYRIEMSHAIELARRGDVTLVPIIARPCDWEDTPLGEFQALPRDAEPITSWPNRDDAWLNVVRGLRSIIAPPTTSTARRPSVARSSNWSSVRLLDASIDADPVLRRSLRSAFRRAGSRGLDNLGAWNTLDCKFINRGNATAVLWKVAIDIVRAEPDVTPQLSFVARDPLPDVLDLYAANRGWGDAYDCDLRFTLPGNAPISLDPIAYHGDILGSDSSWIRVAQVRLPSMDAATELDDVLAHGPISVEGSYSASDGRTQNIHETFAAHVTLGKKFPKVIPETGVYCGASFPSSSVVATIIDPTKPPKEITYPLASQIEPGGAERFHLIVAATQTCRAQVRIRFYVDDWTPLASETIQLDFSVRRQSRWASDVDMLDGRRFVRRNDAWILEF